MKIVNLVLEFVRVHKFLIGGISLGMNWLRKKKNIPPFELPEM